MKSPLSDFVSIQIQRGDFIYFVVLFLCIFAFVALESVWLIRKLRDSEKKQKQLLWSLIPALVLFGLTLVFKTSS